MSIFTRKAKRRWQVHWAAVVYLDAMRFSVASVFLALLFMPACKGDPKPKPPPPATRPVVPSPLENPAGFCRESCPWKVRCRLGKVADKLFQQEVQRCRLICLRWIKTHAREAAAFAPCYRRDRCSVLRGCLAEVSRIVADRKIPAKIKECKEMCVNLGACQGDETDCRLRCQTDEVAIFRALIRCGTKRCPALRTCVKKVLSEP